MKQKGVPVKWDALSFCTELFGFAEGPQFAGQKLLGQRGQFIVRKFPLLVKLHLRLGGLAPAPLALLRHVTLIV